MVGCCRLDAPACGTDYTSLAMMGTAKEVRPLRRKKLSVAMTLSVMTGLAAQQVRKSMLQIRTRSAAMQTSPVADLVAKAVGKPTIWPARAGRNLR